MKRANQDPAGGVLSFVGGRRFVTLGLWLGAFLLVAGCGGDNGNGPTPPTQTAEELTESGWEKFEQGNLTGARDDFDAAIDQEAAYGPAYVGQGWSRTGLAASPSAHRAAVASFDGAIERNETGAEVRAGRAAAHLGADGQNLSSAIADAQAARQAAPQFIFEHRESFTVEDLHLIEAFALAGQGNWTGALAAADEAVDSGIEQGDSGTWVVDGTTYTTFESAVLAFLQKVSVDLAG
ncbi:MAG: hypothetical protein GF346_10575 [Candidatus Eisenbacteria bacterium]|nr:hypothetical protein [Candidatus Latescibacterota bacterium]MBD3302881.1 hypothetical protein [Candidatus Eisenbacteria bacterium]